MAKKKFTTSDALAIGTAATSLVGSFSPALRYDPNAGKPRLFNPIVRPSVGDPNLDRNLRDIDAGQASSNRALRDVTGSDQNAGILGILQNQENRNKARSTAFAKHADLIELQEQRGADTRNLAERYNLDREFQFDTTKQATDVQDTRRVREAAKTSLQSGLKYVAGRDAFFADSGAKEKQANTAIDLSITKSMMDWEVGVSQSYIGRPEEFKIAKDERQKLLEDTLLKHKSYNYHDDPNAVAEPTKREQRKSAKAAPPVKEESTLKKFLNSPLFTKAKEVETANLEFNKDITAEEYRANYDNYSAEQRAAIEKIIVERAGKEYLDSTAQ